MFTVIVRRILHERHAMPSSKRSETSAREVEEGSNDSGVSVQRGKAARTGVAQNAHEHGFELVVEGVRGYDPCRELSRDLFEELPPGPSPLFFNASDGRRAAGNAEESGAQCLARNEGRGPASGATGAVVECRDSSTIARTRGKTRGSRKKYHRVESTANSENESLVGCKRRLECAFYFSSAAFSTDHWHSSFNLPIDWGVLLGDGRPAGNLVGFAWPDRVLPGADLAEYATWYFPDTVTDGNPAQLATRLAQTPQRRAGAGPGDRPLPGIKSLVVGAIAKDRSHVIASLDKRNALREHLRIIRSRLSRPLRDARLAGVVGRQSLHNVGIFPHQRAQVRCTQPDVRRRFIE